MYKASFYSYKLLFNEPAGTSRGVIYSKTSYFIEVWNEDTPDIKGIGECSILDGLSPDDRPGIVEKLTWCCENVNDLTLDYQNQLIEWPAISFAFEMAFLDLANGGKRIFYQSAFTDGKMSIPINGLIWMGSIEEMSTRINKRLEDGFKCLKLKIGALDFESELELLIAIRKRFSKDSLELRVDANGAYTATRAPTILERLSRLGLHSIEQPLKAGQWDAMASLSRNSPVPIALDEELIGINGNDIRFEMLEFIKPAFIVLKPSLTGGFKSTSNWIDLATRVDAGWWVTSALESNVGLDAIAQWTATLGNEMVQGLGTGGLFSNNFNAPLEVENGRLFYRPKQLNNLN